MNDLKGFCVTVIFMLSVILFMLAVILIKIGH